MMKSVRQKFKSINSGQIVDMSSFCVCIETNFSGIYKKKYLKNIKESRGKEGSRNKDKKKRKYTSELMFKELYIREIKKNESVELSPQEEKEILRSQEVFAIIQNNISENKGRYLLLFYDSGLTLNILFRRLKR
jgi:hypothetical protein